MLSKYATTPINTFTSLEKDCAIPLATEMILLDSISEHEGSEVYHHSKLFSMSEFAILLTCIPWLNWQPFTEDMKERKKEPMSNVLKRSSRAPLLHLFLALLGEWGMLQQPLTDALPQ